jgi:hypothetical protein
MSTRKSKSILWLALVLIAALLVWVGVDLFVPRRVDIRRFNAEEVARLDTAMWRSYYGGQPRRLFFQLAELMRGQFHFPIFRSNRVALSAARAAFIFKNGHNRLDYEKALPDLVDYFQRIRDISGSLFDVQHAAELELEWWIVHRERGTHHEGDLARAVAEAAAELYQVPVDKLMEYGSYRAAAMTIRDTKAATGGVSEDDWREIHTDLLISWQSLWKAVQTT